MPEKVLTLTFTVALRLSPYIHLKVTHISSKWRSLYMRRSLTVGQRVPLSAAPSGLSGGEERSSGGLVGESPRAFTRLSPVKLAYSGRSFVMVKWVASLSLRDPT